MLNYFIRITHSYNDISGLVVEWAQKCEKLAVFEHCGEQTSKVHCHLCLYNSSLGKKQLRNIGSQYLSLKGNELCSFKEWLNASTNDKPLVYSTKGIYDAKYLLFWTKEDNEIWKQKWVRPSEYEKEDKAYDEYVSMITDNWKTHFYKVAEYDDATMNNKDYYSYYIKIKDNVNVSNVESVDNMYKTYCEERIIEKFNLVKNIFHSLLRPSYKLLHMGFWMKRKTYILTYCGDEGIKVPNRIEWNNF